MDSGAPGTILNPLSSPASPSLLEGKPRCWERGRGPPPLGRLSAPRAPPQSGGGGGLGPRRQRLPRGDALAGALPARVGMGSRPTVGHLPLEQKNQVRILAPQPDSGPG